MLAASLFPHAAGNAWGQFQFGEEPAQESKSSGPKLGNSLRQIWRAGVRIKANGTIANNVMIAMPVPFTLPEQEVRTGESKLEPGFSLDYIERSGCVMQVFKASKFRPSRDLEMWVDYETTKYEILPPDETTNLVIPSKRNKEYVSALDRGPKIESTERQITNLYREIMAEKKPPTDWEKVRALYDYVRATLTYDDSYKGREPKGALETLTDGQFKADCKDMSCLFIALCRSGKIPARIVRLPSHCYAEFYLEERQEKAVKKSDSGKSEKTESAVADRNNVKKGPQGYWFPCQLAGAEAFGFMPDMTLILQKGENFPALDDPRNPKEIEFFAKEQLIHAAHGFNGIPPRKPEYIHQLMTP